MRLFKSIALILSVLFSSNTFAQKVEADQILGTYVLESIITDDIGHVLITKAKDGSYQGRLVWVNHPTNADGSVRCDDNNPDPQLRKRRYDQVYIFRNLKFKKDEWVNGKLYDPFSGKMFSIKFKLAKNGTDLEARYYKGTPALGITKPWKKL
ncbi:MAG: DUF2147 domain-containing protein [Bacteroidales bacterium]|nr:DUF2147 domain-containing protein [Candidatus Colimorpha pelethequi]MCQ2261783.1 DUF2147 domain-containing protein [Bacteroidales bacterium]